MKYYRVTTTYEGWELFSLDLLSPADLIASREPVPFTQVKQVIFTFVQ